MLGSNAHSIASGAINKAIENALPKLSPKINNANDQTHIPDGQIEAPTVDGIKKSPSKRKVVEFEEGPSINDGRAETTISANRDNLSPLKYKPSMSTIGNDDNEGSYYSYYTDESSCSSKTTGTIPTRPVSKIESLDEYHNPYEGRDPPSPIFSPKYTAQLAQLKDRKQSYESSSPSGKFNPIPIDNIPFENNRPFLDTKAVDTYSDMVERISHLSMQYKQYFNHSTVSTKQYVDITETAMSYLSPGRKTDGRNKLTSPERIPIQSADIPAMEKPAVTRREQLSMFSKHKPKDFNILYGKPKGPPPSDDIRFDKDLGNSRTRDCEKLSQRLQILTEKPPSQVEYDKTMNLLDLSGKIMNHNEKASAPNLKATIGFNATEKFEEMRSKETSMRTEQLNRCRQRADESFKILLNGTPWIEKEILRRQLIDVISIQKSYLPHVITARDMKCMPMTPKLYICANYMSDKEKESLQSWASSSNCCHVLDRSFWRIFTFTDMKGLSKCRLFMDIRTKQMQHGEPFNFRIRRQRDSFEEKPWLPYDQHLSSSDQQTVMERGCRLLSDRYSGLFIYCPDIDMYLSSSVDIAKLRHLHIFSSSGLSSLVNQPAFRNDTWKKLISHRMKENLQYKVMSIRPDTLPSPESQDIYWDYDRQFQERNGQDPSQSDNRMKYHSESHNKAKRLSSSPVLMRPKSASAVDRSKISASTQFLGLASNPSATNKSRPSSSSGSRLKRPDLTINMQPFEENKMNTEQPPGRILLDRLVDIMEGNNKKPNRKKLKKKSKDKDKSETNTNDTIYMGEELKSFSDTLVQLQEAVSSIQGTKNESKETVDITKLNQQHLIESRVISNPSSRPNSRPSSRNRSKRKGSVKKDAIRRLSQSKIEVEQENHLRRRSAIEIEMTNALKDIDLKPLGFENKMSQQLRREFYDKLSNISSSNPLDVSLILDLMIFFLDLGLGQEAIVVYRYLLSIVNKDTVIDGIGGTMTHPNQNKHVWPQQSQDIIYSKLLELFLLQRYQATELIDWNSIQMILKHATHIASIKENNNANNSEIALNVSYILGLIAKYLRNIRYDKLSEQLLIGSLMMNPLLDTSLYELGNIMAENGYFAAATKYFNRIETKSYLYSKSRLSVAWIHEFMNTADETMSHLYNQAIKGSTGSSQTSSIEGDLISKAGSLAYEGLGHYYHMNGQFLKAQESYRQAMYADPYHYSSYFFMACLPVYGNTSTHAVNNGYLAIDEADASYRRGLLSQDVRCPITYLSYFAYSQFLIHAKQDMAAAEKYLELAAKLSTSLTVWPTIALAHFYQYIRGDLLRAKHLLIRCLEQRKVMISQMKSSEGSNNKDFYDGNVLDHMNQGNDLDSDEYSIFQHVDRSNHRPVPRKNIDREKYSKEMQEDIENRYYVYELQLECCSLHIAYGYVCYDMDDNINAVRHANAASSIISHISEDNEKTFHRQNTVFYTCLYRLLGLVAWKFTTQQNDAIKYFELALTSDSSLPPPHHTASRGLTGSQKGTNTSKEMKIHFPSNPYTLRQLSIVYALTERPSEAYETMEAAAVTNGIASQNPLIWKALAVMSYLYRASPENAVIFMTKACELSNNMDVEANLLLGQILLESQRYTEARKAFQSALIVSPTSPILWAHLAFSVRLLNRSSGLGDQQNGGYKGDSSSLGTNAQFSYEDKIESLTSLRPLIHSKDSDELMFVATKLLQQEIIGNNSEKTETSQNIWFSSYYCPSLESQGTVKPLGISKELCEVIYLCALYFYDPESPSTKAETEQEANSTVTIMAYRQQAKTMLSQLVEDKNVQIPFPLAAFMMGWITEIEASVVMDHESEQNNIVSTESLQIIQKYFDFSIQCCHDNTMIDSLTFLRVLDAFQDSYNHVSDQLQQLEHSYRIASKSIASNRISTRNLGKTTSRLKQRLHDRMISASSTNNTDIIKDMKTMSNMKASSYFGTDNLDQSNQIWFGREFDQVLFDNEEQIKRKQMIVEYENKLKKLKARVDMHQRYLSYLQHQRDAGKFGKPEILSQINVPKRFLNISPDWLHRFMESFSVCDEWIYLQAAIEKIKNRLF